MTEKKTPLPSLRNEDWKNVMLNKLLTSHIYPTPPLGQDMTQGQFLSGV